MLRRTGEGSGTEAWPIGHRPPRYQCTSRPVSGLISGSRRTDRLPTLVAWWQCDLFLLIYRCGGSVGIERSSPTSRFIVRPKGRRTPVSKEVIVTIRLVMSSKYSLNLNALIATISLVSTANRLTSMKKRLQSPASLTNSSINGECFNVAI